jgi:hypothetical protein
MRPFSVWGYEEQNAPEAGECEGDECRALLQEGAQGEKKRYDDGEYNYVEILMMMMSARTSLVARARVLILGGLLIFDGEEDCDVCDRKTVKTVVL